MLTGFVIKLGICHGYLIYSSQLIVIVKNTLPICNLKKLTFNLHEVSSVCFLLLTSIKNKGKFIFFFLLFYISLLSKHKKFKNSKEKISKS